MFKAGALSFGRVRPVRSLPPAGLSIGVAAVATLLAFGLASVLFWYRAQSFEMWRQPRTAFAFVPLARDWVSILIWFAGGAIAVRERQWIVPVVFGWIGTTLFIPLFSWSGPGDLYRAISPLLEFRYEMTGLASAVNSAMIIGGIVVVNRRMAAVTTNA